MTTQAGSPAKSDTPLTHDPFAGPDLVAFAPITESQREIWLACAINPEVNIGYNEGIDVRFEGPLDPDAVSSSLQALIDRHESMRSTFSPDGNWICIHKHFELALEKHQCAEQGDLDALSVEVMSRPFDLRKGPLFTFTLATHGANLHHLFIVAHHAIVDGWSAAVLLTELGELYSARVEGRQARLERAPRYTDYASVERAFLDSAEGRAHEDYWINMLRNPPNPLDFPSELTRPAQRSFAANRVDVNLPVDLVSRLRQRAAKQGASLVATTLAGFGALLNRLTQSEDMVIGLAAAGQSMHQQGQLVGHCVNTLPLRLRPHSAQTFSEFLKQARSVVLDASDHQGVTYGSLIPKLELPRDESRPPLISIVFNIDVRDDNISHTGLNVSYKTLVRQLDTFESFINIVDDGRSLTIEWSYNTSLLTRSEVTGLLKRFQNLLDAICIDPDRPISELPLMSEEERATVLERFSSGASAPRSNLTIHGAIAQTAADFPDRIAVESGEQILTYRQLMARADAIAAAIQTAGVLPGQFVGVCLQRNLDLPATLIGVMRAGAAYLPLDPDLPIGRLQFMLDDASAVLLVCDPSTADNFGAGLPLLRLDEITDGTPSADTVSADDAAYAIYTSGSTGKPKGVVAHHRGVLNCLAGTVERIPVNAEDGMLALATYAFDASILELYLPLVQGARLVVVTREEAADGKLLAEALEKHRVTRIFTAPAAWRLLIAAGWQGSQEIIGISWAEALRKDLAVELLPRLGQLWNLYGPTETTVWMLGDQITDANAPITIGKPISNTQAYILDDRQQPVPIGTVGELYIGGQGVALGYLNRPELDAEKFHENPFGPGRMYRTGDLARWTADGKVVCLGRADHQVKLRGYRIELGEIETELAAHASVAECACDVRERAAGDPRLVAWVQFQPGEVLTAAEMRTLLRRTLPSYMIPQHFVEQEALPRLPNGKLDRRNLSDPFVDEAAAARTPPQGPLEEAIAAIWKETLGGVEPSRDDRFIDIGGHSLLAVQVAARLEQQFKAKPALRIVMMESLAVLAQAVADENPAAAGATSEPGTEPSPPSTVRQVTANKAIPESSQGGAFGRIKRLLGL